MAKNKTMKIFFIFALLFNVVYANNSFTENKPSHWCNLPYGYVEQSSVRGFNFMRKNICGIYKITSPKGRIYIGQSVDVRSRIWRYKSMSCKAQLKLYLSLLKHGYENHKFEIIRECDIEDLDYFEIYYINKFDTFGTEHGLNLSSGGHDRISLSPETKERMSISQKRRFLSQRHPNKGVVMSTEQREKLRIHNTGKKLTEETKIKISNSHKGKKRTPEHQEKLSSQRRGKPPRQVKCKYCGTEISFLLVNRWHNENCKNKPV